MKLYLFVCGAGEKRSPVAANVAREMLQERGIDDVFTDYAGLGNFDLLKKKIRLASRIYVMEEIIKETIRDFPGVNDKEIYCLGVPSGLSNHPESLEAKLREILAELLK